MFRKIDSIGETPVRIILWCPKTKMLIKACFLIQPLEQEGGCQQCCISLCSKMFMNHFYQMKATVYPKKYAHIFVVLCFVVVMQSFIMNSHEVFIHIHQGCFAGTGAIVRLPQCQWSKPDGYGKISQCITTTKHSKAKTVCIFLGIYCSPECLNILIYWSKYWVNRLRRALRRKV